MRPIATITPVAMMRRIKAGDSSNSTDIVSNRTRPPLALGALEPLPVGGTTMHRA